MEKSKNSMNLLLFSSKNMQKEYFLTNFELVTTFFSQVLRWPGCLWASLFCLIDWFWIQSHASALSSKSTALFYSGDYLVTSQLRTLVELWRESSSTISLESNWAGASCYTLGKRRRNQPIRGPFFNSQETNNKCKS